ncbi:hypothetical protein MAPG_01986 [Magnaporthiopsis poae ATCC 64411]|uniref:Uncharacterized protein n=1 Tax=Magnaporthiopsis poae (strain ATCC 64411 / 73-15) TaxID=644358 RepID=A0A0C4DQ48_MAGP6|nr:hypothetical protein MAPG_01986 [Magnaporthiopsis poae ATCC 64411]
MTEPNKIRGGIGDPSAYLCNFPLVFTHGILYLQHFYEAYTRCPGDTTLTLSSFSTALGPKPCHREPQLSAQDQDSDRPARQPKRNKKGIAKADGRMPSSHHSRPDVGILVLPRPNGSNYLAGKDERNRGVISGAGGGVAILNWSEPTVVWLKRVSADAWVRLLGQINPNANKGSTFYRKSNGKSNGKSNRKSNRKRDSVAPNGRSVRGKFFVWILVYLRGKIIQ